MTDEFTAHSKAKARSRKTSNMDADTWALLYEYLDAHIQDYDLEGATSEVVDLIADHFEEILERWDPNR